MTCDKRKKTQKNKLIQHPAMIAFSNWADLRYFTFSHNISSLPITGNGDCTAPL